MQESQEIPAKQPQPFENAGKHHAHAREETGTEAREKLLTDFREYLVALKRARSTVILSLNSLTPFFAFIDGCNLDLRAVALRDMEAYKRELQKAKRYTAHTRNTYLRAVRRFYTWQERTGKVLVDPTDGLHLSEVKDSLPKSVLTLCEIRKLLDAPDTSTPCGIRDKTLLEVFYSTGIRLAELCALTVYDVDVPGGYVRVNNGKGAKDRVVPMGRKATQYVREYLRQARGIITRNRRDERALFVGRRGKRIQPGIVQWLIRCYARKAGIRKHVTPHALRHTCATHLLQGGADITHVQRLLGHVNLTTTQIYTRVAAVEVKATHARTHPRETGSQSAPKEKPA